MAQITWGNITPLDFFQLNLSDILDLTVTARSATRIAGDYRLTGEPEVGNVFLGSGFTFDAAGLPNGGVVSSIVLSDGGGLTGRIDGLAIPATQLIDLARSGNDEVARATLLAGDDTIIGSPFDDFAQGYGGNDVIALGDGNDNAFGGAGNDVIDGGAGLDGLILLGSPADYDPIVWNGRFGALPIRPEILAADGIDKAFGIEVVGFVSTGDIIPTPADNFSPLDYIASHPDLAAAFGPNAEAGFDHYLYAGAYEGRVTTFDGLEYIASNGDLILAFGADAAAGATHYIVAGAAEGRTTDGFDAVQYLANYSDLQAAFGSDTEAATKHYITNGFAEHRNDDPPGAAAATDFLL